MSIKNSQYLKCLLKCGLKSTGVPDHKQYMLILQLLGKEGSLPIGIFPLLLPSAVTSNSQAAYGKALKASSGRIQASEATENRPKIGSISRRMNPLLIYIPD